MESSEYCAVFLDASTKVLSKPSKVLDIVGTAETFKRLIGQAPSHVGTKRVYKSKSPKKTRKLTTMRRSL